MERTRFTGHGILAAAAAMMAVSAPASVPVSTKTRHRDTPITRRKSHQTSAPSRHSDWSSDKEQQHRMEKAQTKRQRKAQNNLALLLVLCSFLLSGCRAIEAITRSNDIYYHSDCHPDIWTTQIPEKATDNCNWTLVESQ